jgi:hypothetical protein
MLAACPGEVDTGSPMNDMRIQDATAISDPAICAGAIQFRRKWL